MLIVLTSVSVRGPPAPVLPPSLLVIVRLTEPLALATGTYFFADSRARRDLHSFPTRRSSDLPVPEPVTVTPPEVVPVRVPLATLRVRSVEHTSALQSQSDSVCSCTQV